jgi:hypothetical protein
MIVEHIHFPQKVTSRKTQVEFKADKQAWKKIRGLVIGNPLNINMDSFLTTCKWVSIIL